MKGPRKASGLVEVVVSLAIITLIAGLFLSTGPELARGVQLKEELEQLDRVAADLATQVYAGGMIDSYGTLEEPLENWTFQVKNKTRDRSEVAQLTETHITLQHVDTGQSYTFVQVQVQYARD